MKIVFISNYHNHHQIPLCDAFVNAIGDGFIFVATEKVPEERIKFGYKHEFDTLSYYREVQNYDDEILIEKLCYESDIVILGSAPISYVQRRIKDGMLTFSYSERLFKEGFWKHPGDIYRAIKKFTMLNNNNFYQLCASAYTASDAERIFAFPNRSLKWGYFPKINSYDIDKLISCKPQKKIKLLWCARFLDWKHPEKAILIAKKLKELGCVFEMEFIGNGELFDTVVKIAEEENLLDCINFIGAVSSDEVRKYMEQANIFLFTSDRNEGWGAVLNEAMNSGCCVVASHAIGSVPFLIKDNFNGMIYKDNDFEELFIKVKTLIDNPAKRNIISKNAYHTMIREWNAENAVSKFLEVSREIFQGNTKNNFFEEGVCSTAENLKDDWYK